MSKRAHIRRRQESDDDEDKSHSGNEDSNGPNSNDGSDNGYEHHFDFLLFIFSSRTKMEDLKLIQKLRQRKNGLTAEELALGKQTTSKKLDVRTSFSGIQFLLSLLLAQ